MAIYVGTSSWTDPTLVRDTEFYPPGASTAEERLRHYASIFPVVEVDSTFYAPRSPDVARLWVERTPSTFRMEIKSYGLFTGHPVRPVTIWKDLRSEIPVEHQDKPNVYEGRLPEELVDEAWLRFEGALRPLHDAGQARCRGVPMATVVHGEAGQPRATGGVTGPDTRLPHRR